MTHHLPIYVAIEGKLCCVVGGGPIAAGRAQILLGHGATLRLVSPAVTAELEEMIATAQITEHRRRPYQAGDLDGCRLVIAATDDPAVNRRVRDDARAAGALCNVADNPSLGDFTVPAIVRRGDLTFAVTTGGASPVVAADVRRRLEAAFGPEWGTLLELLSDSRDLLKARYPDPAARAAAVRELLDGDVLSLLAAGDTGRAADRVRAITDGGAA